jgi:hypothetical protein
VNIDFGDTAFVMGVRGVMRAKDVSHFSQGSPGGFASTARNQARQILSGSQFQTRPQRSLRPLAGALGAIGRFLDRVFGPLWRFIDDHVLHPVSGPLSDAFGDWWPLLILAVALVAGVLVGRILIKRRALPSLEFARVNRAGAIEDPDDLEEMARRAELDGDLQGAVRLRFRAGVIRLERIGAVSRGPTLTDRELSTSLRSTTFDSLAADLESIVYGGAPATEQQAADALAGWRNITLEASRNLKLKEKEKEKQKVDAGPKSVSPSGAPR